MMAMSRHWPTASGSVQGICPGCSRDTWAPARCKSLKPPAYSGPSGFSTRPTLRCRRLPGTLVSAACVDSTPCLRKYIDGRQPRSGALATQVVRNIDSWWMPTDRALDLTRNSYRNCLKSRKTDPLSRAIFAMHNVLARAPSAFAKQVLPTGTESGWGQNPRRDDAVRTSAVPLRAAEVAQRRERKKSATCRGIGGAYVPSDGSTVDPNCRHRGARTRRRKWRRRVRAPLPPTRLRRRDRA